MGNMGILILVMITVALIFLVKRAGGASQSIGTAVSLENVANWKDFYSGMINKYALLSGAHVAAANATGQPFTPKGPLGVLVKEAFPQMSEANVSASLSGFEKSFKDFLDGDFFKKIVTSINTDPSKINSCIDDLKSLMHSESDYNALFVRYCLGELVELKFGHEQKESYWRAIIKGEIQ